MPLPSPPAVIFDWDGTLVNSVSVIYAAVNKTRAVFGLPPEDPATVRHYTAMTKEQSFVARFGEGNAARAIELYQGFIEEVHAPTFSNPAMQAGIIMPGAVDVLDRLAEQNILMLVVSNKTSVWLHKEVAYLGWQKYFRVVQGAQDTPTPKPDARAALQALQLAGVQPVDAVLFVGDSRADVECANAAGLTSIYFSNMPYDGNGAPRHTISSYADLLKLL
jgi:phosphoglycolate phosphatase